MKTRMAMDVARLAKWPPEKLAMYVDNLALEISKRQHLKAAAMKAQRQQRKAGKRLQTSEGVGYRQSTVVQ